MAAIIGQNRKNSFKMVEIWENHSKSLKNNFCNDFKGTEYLLAAVNLENEIDTCQTTVRVRFAKVSSFDLKVSDDQASKGKLI